MATLDTSFSLSLKILDRKEIIGLPLLGQEGANKFPCLHRRCTPLQIFDLLPVPMPFEEGQEEGQEEGHGAYKSSICNLLWSNNALTNLLALTNRRFVRALLLQRRLQIEDLLGHC